MCLKNEWPSRLFGDGRLKTRTPHTKNHCWSVFSMLEVQRLIQWATRVTNSVQPRRRRWWLWGYGILRHKGAIVLGDIAYIVLKSKINITYFSVKPHTKFMNLCDFTEFFSSPRLNKNSPCWGMGCTRPDQVRVRVVLPS